MKIAAAHAIAALAREDVPDEVAAAYRGARPVYGPEYIIPSPFDPRLISRVSAAVAEAAMKSGRRQETDHRPCRLSVPAVGAAGPVGGPVPDGDQCGARQAQAGGVRRRRGRFGDPRRRRLPEFRHGQGAAGGPGRCGEGGPATRRHRRAVWRSRCRIPPRKPRPISMRCTSASSGAAGFTATRCAWSPTTATSMPPPC